MKVSLHVISVVIVLCFQFTAILSNLSQSFLQPTICEIYMFSLTLSQRYT